MRVGSKYFEENSTGIDISEKVLVNSTEERLLRLTVPVKTTKRTSILTPTNRKYFIQAWNSQCGACGVTIVRKEYDDLSIKYFAHIDYFVALQNGGENTLDNIWPLCFHCHEEKSDAEIRKRFGGHNCIVCKEFGHHLQCFETQKRNLFNSERFTKLKEQHSQRLPTLED